MIASQPCRLTTGGTGVYGRDWGLGPVLGRAPEESFSNTSIISAGRHRTNKTLTRLFLHMKTVYIYMTAFFNPAGQQRGGTGHPGTVFFRAFPKSVDTKNFVTASQPCSGNDRFHCSNQRVVFERPRSARFPLDDNTSQRRLLSAPRRSKTSFCIRNDSLYKRVWGRTAYEQAHHIMVISKLPPNMVACSSFCIRSYFQAVHFWLRSSLRCHTCHILACSRSRKRQEDIVKSAAPATEKKGPRVRF